MASRQEYNASIKGGKMKYFLTSRGIRKYNKGWFDMPWTGLSSEEVIIMGFLVLEDGRSATRKQILSHLQNEIVHRGYMGIKFANKFLRRLVEKEYVQKGFCSAIEIAITRKGKGLSKIEISEVLGVIKKARAEGRLPAFSYGYNRYAFLFGKDPLYIYTERISLPRTGIKIRTILREEFMDKYWVQLV